MFVIIIESIIVGALAGGAVCAGAARMFYIPEVQSMGSFRTIGELNACKGDPIAHLSFGFGFFFNAAASTVGSGALTQDVLHRIVPNFSAGLLMIKNKKVEETLQDPAKMLFVGAGVGAVVVTFLNTLASVIPKSMAVVASKVLTPAANLLINPVMPIIFILAAMDAGITTGTWGLILGGLSQMIMGNAVPGAVLGILIGQSKESNGYNKSTMLIIISVFILFAAIAYFRGFFGKFIAAF